LAESHWRWTIRATTCITTNSARGFAARRARPRLNVNLTSLIDVTFLLLIYFMVATNMTMGKRRIAWICRIAAAAARPSDPFTLDQEPLRVIVLSTGAGFNDYRVQIDGPVSAAGDLRRLFAFLRRSQINDANAGGVMLFAPDHPIVIQPSRSTRLATRDLKPSRAGARRGTAIYVFGKGELKPKRIRM